MAGGCKQRAKCEGEVFRVGHNRSRSDRLTQPGSSCQQAVKPVALTTNSGFCGFTHRRVTLGPEINKLLPLSPCRRLQGELAAKVRAAKKKKRKKKKSPVVTQEDESRRREVNLNANVETRKTTLRLEARRCSALMVWAAGNSQSQQRV